MTCFVKHNPCVDFRTNTNHHTLWQIGLVTPISNFKMLNAEANTSMDSSIFLDVGDVISIIEDVPTPKFTEFIKDMDGNIVKNFLIKSSSSKRHSGMRFEEAIKINTLPNIVDFNKSSPIAANPSDPVVLKHLPAGFEFSGSDDDMGVTIDDANINIENHTNKLILNQNQAGKTSLIRLPAISQNRLNKNFGIFGFRFYFKANINMVFKLIITYYNENGAIIDIDNVSIRNSGDSAFTDWTVFETTIELNNPAKASFNASSFTIDLFNTFIEDDASVDRATLEFAYPLVYHSFGLAFNSYIQFAQQLADIKINKNLTGKVSTVRMDNQKIQNSNLTNRKDKFNINGTFDLYPTVEVDLLQTVHNLNLNGEDTVLFPFSEQLPPFLIGKATFNFEYNTVRKDFVNVGFNFVEN